jgi:ClpP class serine protease
VNFWNLLWFAIFLWSMLPVFRQRQLFYARLRLLRTIERRRGSRVIAMIHRQESISFLGIPIARYIDIEDSEDVLRAIRLTPPDMPIDVILHTPGGLVLATEQIARAIMGHPARVTVWVPHYAMSGGTLLALAADEIVMDENAVLGPMDPQLGQFPAASILAAVREKPRDRLDDQTLILADVAAKAQGQMRHLVHQILSRRMDDERAREIAAALTEGRWTHDYPLTVEDLRALGIPVSTDMLPEVYALMDLYEQPLQRRPSVQYVPVPYQMPAPARERGGGRER